MLAALLAIAGEVKCANDSLCQHYHGGSTILFGFIVFICMIITIVMCISMTVGTERVSEEFRKKILKRKILAIVLTMSSVLLIIVGIILATTS